MSNLPQLEQNTDRFDRWKDFTLRMARTCYSDANAPNLPWIEGRIELFFNDCIERQDIDLYISWDQVLAYPEGHQHYKPLKDGKGVPPCVCDLVSELVNDLWYETQSLATEEENKSLDYYWGQEDYDKYDLIKAEIVERWEDPVHCCIRSGMDLVFEQSAGVVGFTAGDLQKMYSEGIPNWLNYLFKPKLGNIYADTLILL